MLTQQLGRYLFKTFRTLLANPDAPMSKENKTRDYILKVGSLSHSIRFIVRILIDSLRREYIVHFESRCQSYCSVRG